MNGDAVKEFLLRNGEKIAFGFLVLLSGFLIYSGLQKPDITAKHQPEAMSQRATQVKNSIDDDHWKEINEEASRLPDFNIIERTNKSMSEVNPTAYKLAVPWEVIREDFAIKRNDPKIPAPVELIAHGVVVSIAAKSNGGYPLAKLEPADELEKTVKPPTPPAGGRRGRARMGGEGMMMDSSMMDPAMMGGGYPGGGAMGGYPGGSMMSPGGSPMSPESGMMAPGGPGMAGAGRRIDSTIFDLGFRPTGSATEIKPAVSRFIAGVALMPNKKIFAAFEEALAQADGYDPKRDQPFYLGLELQRLDVTDKPADQQDDSAWVLRANTQFYNQFIVRYWPGFAPEIVSVNFRDDRLTTLIPPVLLDNYAWFASHPKIPLGDQPLMQPGMMATTTKQVEDVEEVLMPNLQDSNILSAGGRTTNSPDFGGQYGAMTGGYGGTMPGMGMYGQQGVVEQPEFKLIRFYDFADLPGDTGSVREGRKYIYRVRIAVEDPNFPSNRIADPRSSTLSAEVYKRVDKLKQQDALKLKTDKNAVRMSGLFSEYSEPSNPVSLPSLSEAYAGNVNPGLIKTYPVNGNLIEFNSKPATTKVVVTKFEPSLGVRVPIYSDAATRGTIFNKKGVMDVPDPITYEVKKTEETAQVQTGNVLVDISGGKQLKISTAETQTEPGVLLMFDPSGGLRVVDEVETQIGYRLYSFAKDRGEE